MGLFDKKFCDVCGEKIGFLGNRKLEDGNLCKNCAKKLSPWFSDRRQSTIAEIKEQLAYREENKKAVAAFHVTRVLGSENMVLLDEDAQKFLVTGSRSWEDENPDVLDFSMVTGCDMKVSDNRSEQTHQTADGKTVSYNPPRYVYYFNFHMIIHVNHPYFEEIAFDLNKSTVSCETNGSMLFGSARDFPEYRQYEELGNEIKRVLTQVRANVRAEAAAAAAQKAAVTCPWCGATTTPTASGCCEYCGGSLKG
jgi:hypothetical protein